MFRRPGCPASPPRQGAHNVGGVRELTAASQLPAGELFVLVAGWFDYAIPIARTLPGRLVEVHCIVPLEVARSRYLARTAQRHAGHLDQARTEQELWGTPPRPLGLGTVLNTDISGEVDIAGLARTVMDRA